MPSIIKTFTNYKTIKINQSTAKSKLSHNQKEDKVSLMDKPTKLIALSNHLNDVYTQLSKTQADIETTQQLIDKLKDGYLNKDI